MKFKFGHYYKLKADWYTLYAVYDRHEHLHILKDTDTRRGTILTGAYIFYKNGEQDKHERWKEISKDEFILEMI